jgi:hypothetical protein
MHCLFFYAKIIIYFKQPTKSLNPPPTDSGMRLFLFYGRGISFVGMEAGGGFPGGAGQWLGLLSDIEDDGGEKIMGGLLFGQVGIVGRGFDCDIPQASVGVVV